MEVLRELRGLIEESVGMLNQSEWSRRQLQDLREVLAGLDEEESEGTDDGETEDELSTALEALDGAIKDFEGLYFDLRLTGALQDSLRWKRLLHAQLTRLAWTIAGTDLPPTASQLEFFHEVRAQVEAARGHWSRLRDEEIPAFNALAATRGVGAVVLEAPAASEP
jgi:hypothetical protein